MVIPGTVVSHYRVERRLGAGGMGEVYLAQDTSLDRPVAIKFLIAPDDEHGRQRLLREARAVAALDHPAICAVYEVGTDPVGGDFIVMQYIEGESLAARLKRGRLLPEEAVRIAGQIAEALQAAHRRGIIHRDLKPHNIIITPAGSPKLLDFGLARQLESSDVAAEAQTVSPLTQPHAVIGTAGYMAPEQLRGRPADARTDVFALGCVLYECLTGRRAFLGTTAADINGQALHVDPPAVSSVAPDLGPGYDALCARMTKKSAGDRFQSAEEVLGAIRALTGGARSEDSGIHERGSYEARSLDWLGGHRGLATAVVALLLLAASFALWQRMRGTGLAAPSPEAQRWYEQGVEALREGSYAGAKAKLAEAVRIEPTFALALCRLAEADAELDDERGAKDAMLRFSDLVPDRSRLKTDDRLRCDAAQAALLGKHDQAVEAYRKIAERNSGDAGAWLDLGRTLETGERRADARANYEKALALDRVYAAGHLRLAVLQSRAGQPKEADASFNEALRLYRIAGNREGEAEALLRKGMSKAQVNALPDARSLLEQSLSVATETEFVSQRVRARFVLAIVALNEGKSTEAETLAKQAIDESSAASLDTIAANGLIDLATVLTGRRQFELADAQLVKSLELAGTRGARRTEMRAQLARASLRIEMRQPRDALALAEEPSRFFATGQDMHLEATAKLVQSRAQEDLENYAEASRLAKEALTLGQSINDQFAVTTALENLVGQLSSLGRLPEALAHREQIDAIYRTQNAQGLLAYDLLSHADLLIRLGRAQDAEAVLAEIETNIAAGVEAFKSRGQRLAFLRSLLAITQGQFAEALRFADQVPHSTPKLGSTAQAARVLAEFAKARLGASKTPGEAIAAWPEEATAPLSAAELGYWAAGVLAARHEDARAYAVATRALTRLEGRDNPELEWRLAALAAQLRIPAAPQPTGASMRARAEAVLIAMRSSWGESIDRYLARPDLKTLHDGLR